ncbi:MAG: outer membrane protein assembly factor BamC [SAR86 cluster bacterium]|jgi:outer membrane protein assembly factor BamC|nr:outer membrane protein assembly factor BamC [SAR86 cluster bacterium]
MPNKIIYSLYCLGVFSLSSCSLLLDDHRNDYLQESQIDELKLKDEENPGSIVDFYPIPNDKELNLLTYDVPQPEQFFSSGTTNEIRLHKLGELRWVYIESLPSSIWPLMKNYWTQSGYGISFENPDTGIIQSEEVDVQGNTTRLEMKLEHGIRQASSEIFVKHSALDDSGQELRVSTEENLEESILRGVLDYLSDSSRQKSGTSLVALNLNIGKKATLRKRNDGESIIQMNLEFARAWAAVDRALKEALISVYDLDRENGIFYVNFSKKKEAGFLGKLFRSDNRSATRSFRISVEEIAKEKCIVTILDIDKELELSRDLLSEINQSLS